MFIHLRDISFLLIIVGICTSANASRLKNNTTTIAVPIVAKVELEGGHRFEFIDEGNSIAIAEIGPAGSTSNLQSLINRQSATPLEIFLAMTSRKSSPPDLLIKDHYNNVSQKENKEPRILKFTLNQNALFSVDEGYSTSYCTFVSGYQGNSLFGHDWLSDFEYEDFVEADTFDLEDLNNQQGKAWYAPKSDNRWLGACNGNYVFGFPSFRFSAQFRDHLGNWSTAYTTQVEPYYWVRFHSAFGAAKSWRVLLQELGNYNINRVFGVGVAGTEAYGLFIE